MDKFQPTWQSLEQVQIAQWYQDAKFGIFIHWGLYCVPAFGNEWYPRNMYQQGTPEFEHHLRKFGPQSVFGYKDFIASFKAEKYDPTAWSELFEQAGAKFVVPVAEHHDGFAMYECALSRWNALNMGPRRDIVGELARAVKARGLVFGLSSHRAEHWWFMNGGQEFDSDVRNPGYADFYGPASRTSSTNWAEYDWKPRPDALFLEDWLARCQELVDKYQPQLFWFDGWINQVVFQPYLQRFAAHYYNRGLDWQNEVAINYKDQAFPERAAVLDIERGQLKDIRPLLWQNDTSISNNSGGYIPDQDYKNAGDIIGDLVDVVSKNGVLLLNIGPRADGSIPEPEQAILLEIGKWLRVNGEAIYGTRPWVKFGEGPTEVPEGYFTDTHRQAFTGADIRFTRKGNRIYAILMAWPGSQAVIQSLGSQSQMLDGSIQQIEMLGVPGKLDWSVNKSGLSVQLPQEPPGQHAYVLKITVE
jgi:alpha-L-fucosidase